MRIIIYVFTLSFRLSSPPLPSSTTLHLCRNSFLSQTFRHCFKNSRWQPKILQRNTEVKVKSAFGPSGPSGWSLSRFRSMKRLGAFLLAPGWDASPSRGYPQQSICRYPFIHLGGERHCEELSVLPKNTTQCPRPGLEPETSALTMRPLRLPLSSCKKKK